MLIWQASSVILRAMIFTCIQLFFVFKCVGVKEHRKLCFWLIVIYTMLFDSANYTIEILPLYQTSSMLQVAHMMIHAVNTFILFTIVGVFGSGYLPRNYILAEIYYDLLSTVPIMPMFIVAELLQRRFLPPGTEIYTDYPAGCVISVICMFIGLLQVPAFYYLFGKKVNDLLRRIPDNICLFIFLASFTGFVTKQILLLKTNKYYIDNPVTLSYFKTATFDCNCALILSTMIVIMLLVFTAFQSRRLQYIQSLENRMLLDYYTNASSLHSGIRSLRHDLSNHLAALSFMENAADPCRQALMSTSGATGVPGTTDDPGEEYRTSLLGICDSISSQMARQTAWQQIETDMLSSREKYEIHHHIMTVMEKHRIPESALSISVGTYGSGTEISFSIRCGTDTSLDSASPAADRSSRQKPLHLLLLRQDMMFRLIKIIAASHGGTAGWKRSGSVFTLSLALPGPQQQTR